MRIVNNGNRTEWSPIRPVIIRVIGDLTQQMGWKTQDGRMTKILRETVDSRSCATFFRHSAILSLPALLLRKLPLIGTRKRQTGKEGCFNAHQNVPLGKNDFKNDSGS